VEIARKLRREGRSWSRVAESLGLRVETVRRWCGSAGQEPSTASLRAVEVVSEPDARTMVVVSPRGLRVEGLGVRDVIAVLEAIG
jgi:hypothetical protein